MKTLEIKGTARTGLGKKESKKLRAEGLVPCVLYTGVTPTHFVCDAKELGKVIYTPNVYMVNLNIDGTVHKAMLQDSQFHPVEEQILHVDFLAVAEDKPVKIEVPIKVQGYAEGMRKGGKLKVNLRRLKIKALAQNLPDEIPVVIDSLDLGQSVRVGELSMENVEFLNAKAVPVATIIITRAAKAAGAGK